MSSFNPDQYTEQQSGLEPAVKEAEPPTEQQAVIDQLTNWIDPGVIAVALVEEMVDQGIEPTFDKCQTIWLSILTELHTYIERFIHYGL